jgi:hypothetical protein
MHSPHTQTHTHIYLVKFKKVLQIKYIWLFPTTYKYSDALSHLLRQIKLSSLSVTVIKSSFIGLWNEPSMMLARLASVETNFYHKI